MDKSRFLEFEFVAFVNASEERACVERLIEHGASAKDLSRRLEASKAEQKKHADALKRIVDNMLE